MQSYKSFCIVLLCLAVALSSCRRSRDRIANETLQDKNNSNNNVEAIGSFVAAETKPYKEIDIEMDSLLIHSIPSSTPNQLLIRVAYISSYNNATRNPNWVSWHLTKEHTDGLFPRKGVPYYDEEGKAIGIASFTSEVVRGTYFVDTEVPSPRQEHHDWKSRPKQIVHGHMCPAADCKWSKEAMNQSFLLTNMCPQDNSLNGRFWDKLERKCRVWANKYEDIYIVTGPIYYHQNPQTFGDNMIAIPDAFFKVVLCMKDTPKALGFIYLNTDERQEMESCVITIDEIEEITGFDLFHNLPDNVEDVIESQAKLNQW